MTNDHRLFIKDLKEGCFIDKTNHVISLLLPESKPQKMGLNFKPEVKVQQPDFTHFAQSHSQDDLGLTPFNLTLLTQDGGIYLLCPAFPEKMILGEDAYESLIEYCRDSHEQ